MGEIHPNSSRLIISGWKQFHFFPQDFLRYIKSKYEYLSWTGYYAKALLAPSSYKTHTLLATREARLTVGRSLNRDSRHQHHKYIIVSGWILGVSGFHLTGKWRCLQELIFGLMPLIFSSVNSKDSNEILQWKKRFLFTGSWVDMTNTYLLDKWWVYRSF